MTDLAVTALAYDEAPFLGAAHQVEKERNKHLNSLDHAAVIAQAALLNAEVAGMQALNQIRVSIGATPAYDEAAFLNAMGRYPALLPLRNKGLSDSTSSIRIRTDDMKSGARVTFENGSHRIKEEQNAKKGN